MVCEQIIYNSALPVKGNRCIRPRNSNICGLLDDSRCGFSEGRAGEGMRPREDRRPNLPIPDVFELPPENATYQPEAQERPSLRPQDREAGEEPLRKALPPTGRPPHCSCLRERQPKLKDDKPFAAAGVRIPSSLSMRTSLLPWARRIPAEF